MKIIYTRKNEEILVDDEDYEYLNQFNWYVCTGGYASVKNTKISTRLHRLVTGAEKGQIVDHINGNRLDNRKENLRIVTRKQNNTNTNGWRNSTSKYKGVSFHSKGKKWMSQITVNYIPLYLGLHETEEKAAIEYNVYAYIYFGDYAKLNKIGVN